MDLEEVQSAINRPNAAAANFSASNEGSQLRHDINEELISNAELIAAYRTLGLSDEEGMALIARQVKQLKDKDPVNAKQTAIREVVIAARDLRSQGLGVLPGFGTRDPEIELSPQTDASSEQQWTALDREKGTDRRKTAQQKVAADAIKTERSDRIQRDQKRIIPEGYKGEVGYTYDRLGQEAQDTPLSVIARRGGGPDLISLSRAGQKVNTRSDSSNSALLDVWRRLTTAMEADPSLLTAENAALVERLETQLFKGSEQRKQRFEVQELIKQDRARRNASVELANAESAEALAEITRAADSAFPRIPQLSTSMDVDGFPTTARPTPPAGSLAFLGEDGAYYDADPGAVGQTIPTARPGNPLSVQAPALPTGTRLEQEILARLYRDDKAGRPQVDINLEIEELQRRLYGGTRNGQPVASAIPAKWGTLQNAPRTIRGITDLDNALSAVIALGQENNKSFMEMVGEDGGQPSVSKDPGPLEALKVLGYGQPDTTRLLNAVAQLQMSLNSDVASDDGLTPKQLFAETGSGYYRGDQEPIFDAPDVGQDKGIREGRETAPIDNSTIRTAFRRLTGENMSSEERLTLLPLAQQNLQGLARGSDLSIIREPIGGIQGNQNYRYNRTGISDSADIEFALTQQALRRQRRIKAAPGQPTPVLSGEISDRDKRNILNAQLTSARAERDARTQKALPPANNRAVRENNFLDTMRDIAARRSETAEGIEREELRRLITEGRRGSGPGFVRTGDGGMRQVDSSQQYLLPPAATPRAATSYQQASQAPDPVTPRVQQKTSNARATYSLPPSGERTGFNQQRDRRRREAQFLNGAMKAAPYALTAALGLGTGQAIGSMMQEEVAQ
mgnify:FL=1